MKSIKIQFIVFVFAFLGSLIYPVIIKEFTLINYLTGIVIGLSFPVFFMYMFALHKTLKEDIEEKEEKLNFKKFFKKDMYDNFILNSSIVKLYTEKEKWIYTRSESTYLAVLYHKLKNNGYFTREMNQKLFSKLSNDIFGVTVKESTLTHYKKDSDKFNYGGYDVFYNDTLSLFGGK